MFRSLTQALLSSFLGASDVPFRRKMDQRGGKFRNCLPQVKRRKGLARFLQDLLINFAKVRIGLAKILELVAALFLEYFDRWYHPSLAGSQP